MGSSARGGLATDASPAPGLPGPGNMMLGYALLGIQPLAVKALAGEVAAPFVVVFRFCFSLLAIAAICLVRRRGLRTGQPWLLLLRGLLGGIAVLAYFGSIQLAGAGRGTVLNYTYPIWANVLAFLVLGQRPPARFWLLLVMAIVGVALVAWPEAAPSGGRALGVGEMLGIFSAMTAGGAVLTIKLLRETDESLTIIAGFSTAGALMALPLVVAPTGLGLSSATFGAGWPDLTLHHLLLLTTVGGFAFFGHVFFTRGYRGTSVQLGSALSLSVPVIATILGVLVLGEPLTPRFVLGALVVLSACGGIGRLERRA